MIACLRMKKIPVWYSDVYHASDSLKTSVPVVHVVCILQLAVNSIIPESCLVPFYCANRYVPTGPLT